MSFNFIRFYLVGLVLFFIPATRGVFVWLTPLSLLLVIGIILFYHRNWNYRTLGWFSFIILSSFLVEMAGVNTGIIFGNYRYGEGLGPKLYGTPLIIGLNWLYLTYSTHDIASRLFRNPVAVITTGAGLMVLYDVVLEQVAPPYADVVFYLYATPAH